MNDAVIVLGAATLVGGYVWLSKRAPEKKPPRTFAMTKLVAAKAPPLLPPPDFPPSRTFGATKLLPHRKDGDLKGLIPGKRSPRVFGTTKLLPHRKDGDLKGLVPGKQSPRVFGTTKLLPHQVPASFKPVARVFGTTKTHRASRLTDLVPERAMFDQKCKPMPAPIKGYIKEGTVPEPITQSDFAKYYYQFSNWAFPYDRSAGGSAAGLITSTSGVWPLGGGGGWGPRIWGPESNSEGYVAAAPKYSCAYKYQDANNTEWWYLDDTQ